MTATHRTAERDEMDAKELGSMLVNGYTPEAWITDGVNPPERVQEAMRGLTLRQHYAGLALQAIVSSIDSEDNYERLRQHASRDSLKVSEWIARDAVKQADALLAELAKEPK